jgi:hypothetical protein
MFVKVVPTLTDYEIMSLVHKLNENDYIITDVDGEISGLGRRLAYFILYT